MIKTTDAFQRGPALIPFVTAGDPGLDVTEQLMTAMAEAGADLIALGIPFSDPVAEGPVIQRADARALEAGVTTDHIFDLVERVRPKLDIPLALVTYVNPVFTYGKDKFLQRCARGGVSALMVPDLPFEEKGELAGACSQYGVELISCIAPAPRERIEAIASRAEGFLYCADGKTEPSQLQQMLHTARCAGRLPCAVEVEDPQQAAELAHIADGVIVASAVVTLAEQHGRNCVAPAAELVRQMKRAMIEAK